MTNDVSEAIDDVIEFSRRPVPAGQQVAGPEAFRAPEMRQFFGLIDGLPGPDLDQALSRLAGAAVACPPFSAARLAVACGSLVESGGDARRSVGPLLDCLPRFLTAAERIVQGLGRAQSSEPGITAADALDLAFAADPQSAECWRGMTFLAQGLVTHLTRAGATWSRLKADAELAGRLQGLAGYLAGATWLARLLAMRDGSLTVLHPDEGRGYVVEYRNVTNNFHLFTLLQDALIGPPAEGKLPGPRPDPAVVAMARGEADPGGVGDHAAWDYCTWPAAADAAADPAVWVWGEQSPADIPPFEGTQVLVLRPRSVASRGWDANFFGPTIAQAPASARVVRGMEGEEVESWLARLRAGTDGKD